MAYIADKNDWWIKEEQALEVVNGVITSFPQDAYKLRMHYDQITGGTPDVNPVMLVPYGIRHLKSLQIGVKCSFQATNGGPTTEIGIGVMLRTEFFDDGSIKNGFVFVVGNDFNANSLYVFAQHFNNGVPTFFHGPSVVVGPPAGFAASLRCFVMDDSDAGEPYVSIELLQGADDPDVPANWLEIYNANVPTATHMIGKYGDTAIISGAPPAYSPFAGDQLDIDDLRIFTQRPIETIIVPPETLPMIEDFADLAWP